MNFFISQTYIFALKQKNPQTAVKLFGDFTKKLLALELVKAGAADVFAVQFNEIIV